MGSSCIAQEDQLGGFDHLEGWDMKGGRKTQEGRRYGDICIGIADSLRCKAETKTPM